MSRATPKPTRMSSTRRPSRSAAPPRRPIIVSHRRRAQVLPRSQKALRQRQGRSRPGLPARRYAWSARMPLSVLTNFEEFAVYDCRVKPAQTDKAVTARILYLRCDDYRRAPGTRRSPASSPVKPSSKAPSTSSPTPTRPSAARPPSMPPSSTRSRTGADELAKNLALRNPSFLARAELRRPDHHRPHYLPAHVRGPRRRALWPTPESAKRHGHLRRLARPLPQGRRPLQLRPVPLPQGEGPRRRRPTI